MLKYIYNAKQRDGSLVKGEIEASDTNDFLIKLKDMQLYCISYKIIDDFENHSNFKMKGKDLVCSQDRCQSCFRQVFQWCGQLTYCMKKVKTSA